MEGTVREDANINSTTPVQLKQCTPKLSGEYVVFHPGLALLSWLSTRITAARISTRITAARISTRIIPLLCYCILLSPLVFFAFWAFFSIVGAIHYAVWYPRFDLKDVHIRSFNVTPARELSYDMDILIEARHFSHLRRIEQYSYEIRISHVGKRIGASSIPGFHPINNKTMEVSTTQRASLLPLGDKLGDLVRADLNATGRVALRLYIEGQIYTPLFLAMKKRGGWTCDLIVSLTSPFGTQIYDRMCCKDFPCIRKGWVQTTDRNGYRSSSWSCVESSPSCCRKRLASLRSTHKVC